MMFSAPLWLTALSVLAIPLALHLWSRRPRRIIQVGSVRHFADVVPPRARSARLSQPLLLLLRLLALATIVMALAGPRFSGTPLGLPSTLTLVEPALLDDPALDSLRQARATVRLLAPGLPEVRLPITDRPQDPPLPLWQALAEADRLITPEATIDLFARPRLVSLGDVRPAIRATVRWHRTPAPPSRAYAVAFVPLEGDSLQAIYAAGEATAVDYRRVRSGMGSRPHVASERSDTTLRRLQIRLVPADTALARRIEIAVRAVAQELGQRVVAAEGSGHADGEIVLSRETARRVGFADSIFAHWPWPRFSPDTADPRLVTRSQATPGRRAPARDTEQPPRTLELLFIAALLVLLERWLATRPAADAA